MDNTKENKEQQQKIMPDNQKIAPNVNLQFADSTMIASSQYDLKVFFGFSLPTTNPPEVIYHSIISLSPQLAKSLAQSLQKAVDDYEKLHMELNMKNLAK